MDLVQNMKAFVQVAQQGSFAAAGRRLHMSTATVSKHVSALEARIGVRLFDRTTRRVGLTEAGRVYFERCLECLQAIDDADASVSDIAKTPKGSLRVTAPIDFGQHLTPVLAEFMNAHPHLVVDLKLTNRVVDMVEEGVDVAIRVAPSLDGNFVAWPLARTRMAIFGAPAYFRKHGRPRHPDDLTKHKHLVFTEPRPRDELVFGNGGRQIRVKLNATLTSNHALAIQIAAHMGVGLTMMPSFVAGPDVAAGALEPVLTDWQLPELHVFAVYPHRRFLSPKVKVFVQALRAQFGDGTRDPWWPDKLPKPSAAPADSGRRTAKSR